MVPTADILRTAAVVAIVLALDLAWITLQRPMYASLVAGVSQRAMVVNRQAAIAAYVLVVAALAYLVIPKARTYTSGWGASGHGAAVGFIVYGIYNATNATIFGKSYDLSVAVKDTLWGTGLFALAGWLAHSVARQK